jgi:DNA/RNA-binding domain of Phe-tRNA-synthetase-like protein
MNQQINFSVDPRIFAKFPEYRRAILVVAGVSNKPFSVLNDEISEATKTVKDTVILEDSRLAAWREAFANFGIKTRDFRPSVDALVRRVLNNKPLGSISPIVDIGTVVSLKFVLPAGAHPILNDTKEVTLRLASGDEVEVSDGTHPNEAIPLGEPILLDNQRAATRRWVWRQTSQSRIDENTTKFFLNIDALDIIDKSTLEGAMSYAAEIISKTFGVTSQSIVLSTNNSSGIVEV